MNATITSIGIYHPEREIRNSYFEEYLDTSDQWIRERTGIERRFYAAEDEYTTDMCVKAVQSLAENYNKDLSDVDFIIAATSTFDQLIPSVASQIQTRLSIPNAGCIDLSAACAGFVYGIIVAKGLIAAGTHRKILVLGADKLTQVTDFNDRATCILFGDAAGAVLIEASIENHIFKPVTATDGSYGKDLFMATEGAKVNGEDVVYDGNIHQNGRVVFKWAVSTLIDRIQELAKINDLSLQDIDYLIPHSANLRILDAVTKGLDMPLEKCIESVRNYGNTSAASIPLAWHSGIESGKIKVGDKLLLIGFGGGLTAAGICLDNSMRHVGRF
jgi:3-oxoacyl-(acyl-carrier-protein) synthase III